MEVSFDPHKRAVTLADRGLDFADAPRLYDGLYIVSVDDRFDYLEERFLTHGYLDGRMVMFAWTPTDDGIRVFSMRHCHAKEERRIRPRMG